MCSSDLAGAGADRALALLARLKADFGEGPVILASAPGRTELGGNHTDHNHGRVLAAAVSFDCLAAASPSDSTEIVIHSKGFDKPIRVDVLDTAPRPEETGTAEAIVRGVADGFREKGLAVRGLNAVMDSTVPIGLGLSSSAAFELCVGELLNQAANDGAVSALDLARIARRAENLHFGKPCGFMDQLSCALRGALMIDFEDADAPVAEPVPCSFEKAGYRLLVVDTGGDHANLTHEYAAIASEMFAVAKILGRPFLRGTSRDELMEAIPEIRRETGDRPVLRALHFIEEDERVVKMAEALSQGNVNAYLRLVRVCGDSCWRLLQNCVSVTDPLRQPMTLALAMTGEFLQDDGACRIQGGGFAGSIQAYVPLGRTAAYVAHMERVFGAGAVSGLRIRAAHDAAIRP